MNNHVLRNLIVAGIAINSIGIAFSIAGVALDVFTGNPWGVLINAVLFIVNLVLIRYHIRNLRIYYDY